MRTLLPIALFLVLAGSPGAASLLAGSAPSFAAARSYPTQADPRAIAIGDLNGDGEPDLATANYLANTVSVLLNRGDGSFRAKLEYATARAPPRSRSAI